MKNSIKFFDYNLPSNLIAENPRSKREQAKLMIYDQGLDTLNHSIFSNLDEYLTKGDLIILNDCLLYTSPSPRDKRLSRMPSSA